MQIFVYRKLVKTNRQYPQDKVEEVKRNIHHQLDLQFMSIKNKDKQKNNMIK